MKSTVQEIRERFDNGVERFSNLETGQTATMDSAMVLDLKTKGDPPALPGRQQKFDGSGSLVLAPYRPLSSDCRQPQAIEGRSYVQTLLRSGLLLLSDCDQAPLRGQQS